MLIADVFFFFGYKEWKGKSCGYVKTRSKQTIDLV